MPIRPMAMTNLLVRSRFRVSRRATLCASLVVLATCSEGPTSPTSHINCLAAELVLPPVTDARLRLTNGFEGATRRQLTLELAALELSLVRCDGLAAMTSVERTEAILAPFAEGPLNAASPDASAIQLALDAVTEILNVPE